MIGDHMTPAVSSFFVSTEFNDFLYAPIGAEDNKMMLSVLSALSRLNVDPWVEAAQLSALPKHAAARRLASLIERLPGGRWPQADYAAIANRLIQLLPHRGSSKVALAQRDHGLPWRDNSAAVKILICAVLAFTALFIAASLEPSARGDHAEMPAFSTRLSSPAQ